MKKVLLERLDSLKQEREADIKEAQDMWDTVRSTTSNVSQSIATLNTSIIMLGHTLSTFLTNLEEVDENKLNNAVNSFNN